MTDHLPLAHFDRAMTEAELASERKAQPVPAVRSPPQENMTAAWQSYIARESRRAARKEIEVSYEAVGEVLAKERKARDKMRDELCAEFQAELERQIMALRVEFLTIQLDEARGQKRRIA
jgi:hypothetical protein